MIALATRRGLIGMAAGVHLAIAALYSTHWPVERVLPDFLERPLQIYGAYSGAHTHFNFFAPAVSSQARAYFIVTGRDGAQRRLTLDTPNAEANQRIAMMFTFYGVEEARPFLVRSWGVHVLTQNPDADSVEVHVEILDIPTLVEQKSGKVSKWVEVERTLLRRDEISGR